MKYTVTWSLGARNALASMWLSAVDQQVIADASDRVDRNLRDTPERSGVPHGEFFVYESSPLRVYFEVFTDDRLVRVVFVELVG